MVAALASHRLGQSPNRPKHMHWLSVGRQSRQGCTLGSPKHCDESRDCWAGQVAGLRTNAELWRGHRYHAPSWPGSLGGASRAGLKTAHAQNSHGRGPGSQSSATGRLRPEGHWYRHCEPQRFAGMCPAFQGSEQLALGIEPSSSCFAMGAGRFPRVLS